MQAVKFFDPGKGFSKIDKLVLSEIERVLRKGDLILREDVEKFEESVAKYVGTKYCVALNSCTDALYLALRYLKIGYGDEVLVPSRTFVATVQVIMQVGATPVFYDYGQNTFRLTENTKAIIPVHIEGAIDDNLDMFLGMAKDFGIHVIEDAAQSFGATKDGKKAGSFGLAGCFSFYPAKTLGAYGDAGAIVTNDKALYEWVKGARNHFKEDASDWGINSRLDNIQAAILNIKFKQYESALAKREEIAEKYHEAFLKLPIELPPRIEGRIWQDYIIRTTKRNDLYQFLKDNGIETMKNNYPFPVSKLPLAQEYEDETLRLPCNELLEDFEVEYVIEKVKEFYA